VYFATEHGKIIEINLKKDACFRDTTLFSLLIKAPTTYTRINRVRQMAGKHEERQLIGAHHQKVRNQSVVSVTQMSGAGGMGGGEGTNANRNNNRRGTINFVKSLLLQR
jgi:hypothetical protein